MFLVRVPYHLYRLNLLERPSMGPPSRAEKNKPGWMILSIRPAGRVQKEAVTSLLKLKSQTIQDISQRTKVHCGPNSGNGDGMETYLSGSEEADREGMRPCLEENVISCLPIIKLRAYNERLGRSMVSHIPQENGDRRIKTKPT